MGSCIKVEARDLFVDLLQSDVMQQLSSCMNRHDTENSINCLTSFFTLFSRRSRVSLKKRKFYGQKKPHYCHNKFHKIDSIIYLLLALLKAYSCCIQLMNLICEKIRFFLFEAEI